ncbi:MAG TPA: CDP-diacylglycerol--glycerol-3-phosphate 3-phosphatidyltransferase [Candidatus Onthovivens sp.]|nr:CDP-diacylglycerol--glycerol-3-phosphate 3-phosphatidyltransferase [Candidatus Onthovivens sp.]
MKLNLPTKITIARIFLAVSLIITVFVLYFLDLYQVINIASIGNIEVIKGSKIQVNYIMLILLAVFAFASFTDFLDGYLARKYNLITDLGKFLDPLADKMLVNSMLIFLAVGFPSLMAENSLTQTINLTFPFFLVIIMIIRDLIVDSLRFIAAQKGRVIAANIFGKGKTVLEMVTIIFILMNGIPFSLFDINFMPYLHITDFLCYLTTILSVVSGGIYLKENFNVFKE